MFKQPRPDQPLRRMMNAEAGAATYAAQMQMLEREARFCNIHVSGRSMAQRVRNRINNAWANDPNDPYKVY